MNAADQTLVSVPDGLEEWLGTTITHGTGLRLFRSDGVELLDAISGTFNVPLGHNHPTVVAAIKRQVERVAHLSSELVAPEAEALTKRLVSLAPAPIGAAWLRDVTGSTAIEGAIKIAQKATGAHDVISMFYGHHGQTHIAAAVSGTAERRNGFSAAHWAHALRVPAPYCYRCFYGKSYPSCELLCVDRIEDFIQHASSGSVACLIIEPVFGNGGNIVPPRGYFRRLQDLCRNNGILLVVDEVQTGLGRTGHLFACEIFDIEPDIMVLAKGLGGIGVPVAAILMRADLDVLERWQHSFTSGSNLLGIAAAHATLDVVTSPSFLPRVRRVGSYLGSRLRALGRRHRRVGDVRGVGMMWGLELVRPDGSPDGVAAAEVVKLAASKHHLLLRTSGYGDGNVVKVRPALVASRSDINEIVGRLERSLEDLGG